MELKEIKELLKAFDESSSSYLSIKQEDVELKLKKPTSQIAVVGQQAAQPVVQQMVAQPDGAAEVSEVQETKVDGELVLAPLVGVFYSAPSPEEKPYVQVGDKVKSGQVLCLIEAMKMMSEITCPKDGVVKEIYVKNQDVVGFEEKLFLIGD
ncbi:acetyl-CoA carboxylase biotin carboxyl carrier protein [Pseudobutyrivibrio sp.]|uniref:acetyl-CoA carboxylase biotin carboxyl carrier protein n=1 Tax=Pseudobutyrivibrio sp. TaxID=2014367 RepID=UPI001DA18DEB|nr:acetyl-CoA carboxylase biotin carboxyl carrier protein [Pseudobutyrivibrio sp.]MBE5911316.1 acetyl-CoA carboxylase biotin carboxyl carrier protein [Pseudobutyrivibrio sp.]